MRPELCDLPEPNWFWHGAQILDLLEQYRPMVGVELGANRGCSAIATARVLSQWGGVLTCVDQWVPDGKHLCDVQTFMLNLQQASITNVRIAHGRTEVIAAGWTNPIDYLYIDADHTYEAVTSDLRAWWPHLKTGGLIAGDDYEDPYDNNIPQAVTRAWDHFELQYGQAFQRTVSPDLAGYAGRPASRLIWGLKR